MKRGPMNIDARQFLSTMQELIEKGETVPIPVSGFSMRPFLANNRDTVLVSKTAGSLKKGDIALYQRKNGQYILHRIVKVHPDNTFDLIGDAQTVIETHVALSQIIGIVTKINRNGKWITPNSPSWNFYSRVWIHSIPLRKIISFLRHGS